MKKRFSRSRMIFISIVLVSLFVVFFVGRKFDSTTFKRSWIVTPQWLEHFRKGLDISGGTKLVYKIDYQKYKDLYKNEQEFLATKKLTEDVIIKNIDGRISKLWVSDYKSYIQSMENETQVVVEIWGVADLDQAKEIIGKTVELEFRIQNLKQPSQEDLQKRRELAEFIRNDIQSSPSKMLELYGSKQSDNVFARSFTGVSLAQMSEVYQKNADLLMHLQIGEISPILEQKYRAQELSGSWIEWDLLEFVIVKVNAREEVIKDRFSAEDILLAAHNLGIEPKVSTTTSSIPSSGQYLVEWRNLIFNAGEVAEKDKPAFDVRVISIDKPTTIGKSIEESQTITEQFQQEVEKVKAALAQDSEAMVDTWEEIANGYASLEQMQQLAPGFTATADLWVSEYSNLGKALVVVVKNIKAAGEERYYTLSLEGIQRMDLFEKELKNQVLFDLDEITIQDRSSRELAQGKDGSVLNGAFFENALPGTTQFGQPAVSIRLNSKGKEIFCEVTKSHVGESMGIFIWGVPVTIANINEPICDGEAQISGGFGKEEAKATAEELNSWKMPAPLILMQEEKVSPTLWQNAFKWAIIATLVWMIAILIYVFFIYGIRKSVVVIVTIGVFMLVLMMIVKLFDYALSLSGIAAIILALGMAIDANILIFERMNEEVESGKSWAGAIDEAKKRSRSAIRDGQISTLLIGLLLYSYGMNMFKGFGTMIIITALLTLFLNVPLIQETLHILYEKRDQKK